MLEEGYQHFLWLMSFQLPSPAFLGLHLMQKSLFQVLIQQKDCEHNGAHDTVTSGGTQKHTMAKRKAILRCFLGWLKVLMTPLGCPGTSSAHRAHLLCLHRVTLGRQWLCPHHRGQDASTPKYPWVSSCPRPNHSQKRQQRQSTGCWAVCSSSSSEMERRQQDRWLLPEFRTHASSGLASGMSSPVTLHHKPARGWGK